VFFPGRCRQEIDAKEVKVILISDSDKESDHPQPSASPPAQPSASSSLILEENPGYDTPPVAVHENLSHVLEPHQREGIRFLYEATIGSIDEDLQQGAGALLAHCMGLGKSLQVLAFLHTILNYPDTSIRRALVVGPKNTVLNWNQEFV
jgi:transcriptional regulator ATRX